MTKFLVKLSDGTEFVGARGFREWWADGLRIRFYRVIGSVDKELIGKTIRCWTGHIVFEVKEK
jgi:hypothetical protein